MIISCLIISVESPQLFVAYLLLQSCLIVFFMGLKGEIWYAYILFLVFLGGMLILFVYARSLASEVKLDYTLKKYFIVFFRVVIVFLLAEVRTTNFYFGKLENYNIEGDRIKEIVSNFRGVFYLYVVGYLLLTLYNVCWVMKIFEGPLQKFTL